MFHSNPEISNQSKPRECGLYKPGHLVHWIQARVKRNEERVPVKVDVLDDQRIRVLTAGEVQVFYHHDTSAIFTAVQNCVNAHIKLVPTAHLIEIQSELATSMHGGVFSLFYLSIEPIAPCEIHIGTIRIQPEG